MQDRAVSVNPAGEGNPPDWALLIRDRRKQLGLRQGDLANLAGVSVRTVSSVEAGKETIRLDVLDAVLHTLGISLTLSAPGHGDVAVQMDHS